LARAGCSGGGGVEQLQRQAKANGGSIGFGEFGDLVTRDENRHGGENCLVACHSLLPIYFPEEQ
jgi:hypothetical protein